jgi:CubicO group peptidase (beta-lactamase class C family)
MKNLPRLNNLPWLSCLLLLLVHGVSVGFRGGVPSPGLQAELASNPDLSAIRAYIEQEVQRQRLPGLAVAITHGEQTIFLEGFGHSRKGEPITPYTPFFIGSLTKSFTALAILQLIEAGLVDLDAPVQHYLPWFRVADEQAGSQITVHHLLNQTSGMSYRGYRSTEMPVEASMEENGRGLASARLTASPGTRFQYFNANYVLLGLVIEAVSVQPYDEYLAEHIFEPLGMEATNTDLQRAQAAGLAQGYNPFLGIPVARQQRFLGYDLPAGFILSNAADLAHYLSAYLNAGRFGEGTNPVIGRDRGTPPAGDRDRQPVRHGLAGGRIQRFAHHRTRRSDGHLLRVDAVAAG